jgi:hypothetical protein
MGSTLCAQADSGRAQDTQALPGLCLGLFRLCSGSGQVCSPSAQVKAALAHVRRLKQNQRKGKLILSLWVLLNVFNTRRSEFLKFSHSWYALSMSRSLNCCNVLKMRIFDNGSR